ncbi:MAG: hypothetical protein EOO39_42735 [Cytophagaceae bacterium]|nr:MAG: hypothetical protein EOO39_42735 [Cytophagaceae bacterium]
MNSCGGGYPGQYPGQFNNGYANNGYAGTQCGGGANFSQYGATYVNGQFYSNNQYEYQRYYGTTGYVPQFYNQPVYNAYPTYNTGVRAGIYFGVGVGY